MKLFDSFKNKSPQYIATYDDLIDRFTLKQGGRRGYSSEEQKFEQGRFFDNKYEIFMYAVILGLKRNYRLPLHDGAKKEKFWEINNWKPKEMVDYIIMCLLTISDIDLNKLEHSSEDEISEATQKLKLLLEEYANGGLDILRSTLEENPDFANNELCFIDLLHEVTE